METTVAALTVTDFLLARLAEDEAEARCDSWNTYGAIGCGPCERINAEVTAKRALVDLHAGEEGDRERGRFREHTCPTPGYAGPDYFLYDEAEPGSLDSTAAPCPTLKLLALPYAGHPDYLPEWSV